MSQSFEDQVRDAREAAGLDPDGDTLSDQIREIVRLEREGELSRREYEAELENIREDGEWTRRIE